MEKETRAKVLEGLEKIAFGDVRDPVRLLFCDELSAQTLRRMDLFSVAEIKRPKGGGMEIRFWDRIRALQCMLEMGEAETESCGFAQALEQGALALREEP